jgi:hypothetical protein
VDIETEQRALRRFLNLRLIDLERETGIPAPRISEAERGVLDLRPAEQRIVTNFLREKLAAVLADETERSVVREVLREDARENA